LCMPIAGGSDDGDRPAAGPVWVGDDRHQPLHQCF
jgi:hypothetical protein